MAVKNEVAAQVKQTTAEEYIQTLVDKAKKAHEAFMALDQEQVDTIVHAMALAGLDKHIPR